MRRADKILILVLVFCVPHIFGGAVCSQALDIPLIVKGTLPNQYSKKDNFDLNIDKALANANIKPINGKVPPNAPETLTISYADVFNLTKKSEFQKYGARIHSAYINQISIEIIKNQLNIGIPKINLAVKPVDSRGFPIGKKPYLQVAALPPLAKGALGTPAELVWNENTFDTANQYLKKYTLGLQLSTTLKLKPGQPIPKGLLRIFIHFEATFVLKAI